jgi:hypothetical protein
MTDIFGAARTAHFDELEKSGICELDPDRVISEHSAHFRIAVQEKMELRCITAALGVTPHRRIPGQDSEAIGALIRTGGVDFEGKSNGQDQAVVHFVRGDRGPASPAQRLAEIQFAAHAGCSGSAQESIEEIDDRLFSVPCTPAWSRK